MGKAKCQEWNQNHKYHTTAQSKEQHRPTAHQSIVVFTKDAAGADRCIKLGFFIDSQKLKAEKYAHNYTSISVTSARDIDTDQWGRGNAGNAQRSTPRHNVRQKNSSASTTRGNMKHGRMPNEINGKNAPSYTTDGNSAILHDMTHEYTAPRQQTTQNYAVQRRKKARSILNGKDTQEYALLLLQEHCQTYKQKYPLLHQSWTAIDSTFITERPSRTAIYLTTGKYSPLHSSKSPYPTETSRL